MTTCIKCGKECEHNICMPCAGTLVDNMSMEDQIIHAKIGIQLTKGEYNGIKRPLGYYSDLFTKLKRGVR